MTLDEAIQHCKEQVQEQAKRGCYSCAEEHQQLAEWLKELKEYKEQRGERMNEAKKERLIKKDIVSIENRVRHAFNQGYEMGLKAYREQRGERMLPSVTPQQRTGRWMPVGYDGYADGNPVYDWWECSECGWEHSGDEESLTAFCPNCGCKMEVEE